MATVRFYERTPIPRNSVRTIAMPEWKAYKTLSSDEVEGFLSEQMEEGKRNILISFRETFYSREKRFPGIYSEHCGCDSAPNLALKIVLEEVDANKYSVRIYGHRWECIKGAYDLLRRGRLFPNVRWDTTQVQVESSTVSMISNL